MGNNVVVRTVTFGEGLPKICIPLTDSDFHSLKQSAQTILDSPLDFVEWRADFYNGLQDEQKRLEALQMLRDTLSDIPILFTIRTRSEGGQADLTVEEYSAINQSVIESGLADLVDVELLKGDHVMTQLCAAAHKTPIHTPPQDAPAANVSANDSSNALVSPDSLHNKVKIVGSRHDFSKTPEESEIVASLCKMQELGADIAKFAVMPTCERDVLTLLSATLTMKEHHNDTPVITMSMGRLGALSRICGTLSGSAVTFGTVGHASAPGQLPASVLKTFLDHLA